MKKSALLVNTSRGPLINESALVEVLREGKIGGVALDVYDVEPLPADSPWRKADEFKSLVVLSPHMGYVNAGTMNRWYQEQAENVERWLKGEEVLNKMN
jgi:phosphoglycerate dehydrogenase-like enzyme